MTYQETLNYLFDSAPMFQQVGKAAYKEGLENTNLLDEHFGHPHRKFRTIHIAGTNGKGSCSHTLAAILQSAGYKTGLYTSPHLIDFRERIRINGKPIPEEEVIRFVEKERSFFEPLHPSFFELTTAMAFNYFAEQQVDIAVIEVGLGGRLDCTNIIVPELSIITNISMDHMQFLGNTLDKIAAEKAGIIKPGIPVVIGETTPETRPVFLAKAREENAPIHFAEDIHPLLSALPQAGGGFLYQTSDYPNLQGQLGGFCQEKNTNTLLTALPVLHERDIRFTESDVRKGFAHVCELTGLMGRWQRLAEHPTLICDTGHNVGGWKYLSEQLKRVDCHSKRIVFGMVNDKDIDGVLELLPKDAVYYFTKANTKRALSEIELQKMAIRHGLVGNTYPTVKQAYEEAKQSASQADLIFVGGSSYVVADFLCAFV